MAKKRQAKSGRRKATVLINQTARHPSRKEPANSGIVARRRPNSRWIIAGVVGVLVVALVAVSAYVLTRRSAEATANTQQTTGAAATSAGSADDANVLGVPIPDEGRTHVAEGSAISYRHMPPASGPHYPSPKPWGIYTETVAPGYWVHNLEHGGIVVLYDCPTGCSTVVTELQQAFKTFPKDKYGEVKLVVTPYSGLPKGTPVMAVAWDFQKSYNSFDPRKLLAFYNGHVDRGPEDIP